MVVASSTLWLQFSNLSKKYRAFLSPESVKIWLKQIEKTAQLLLCCNFKPKMSFIDILNIIYIVHNEWKNCTFWTEFINFD